MLQTSGFAHRLDSRAVIALAIMSALLSSRALAQSPDATVQSLYSRCKSEDMFEIGLCLGYVGGVAHMLNAMGGAAREAGTLHGSLAVESAFREYGICSSDATIGAYRQSFTNWAEGHPEEWNSHMGVGVALALRETWPCTEG